MLKVNIHDAKTNLSKYLANMGQNDRLIICNRNEPVAEVRIIKPMAAVGGAERPIGVNPDSFELSKEFFEPLPEDLIKHFR